MNEVTSLSTGVSGKKIARTFAEFLADPLTLSPRPEFIDNFYVEDDTALVASIRSLNRPAIAALLEAGCNPNLHNKKGVMPISAAAHKGDTSIIELLIAKGALVDAINISGSTALIQAAHFGHVNAVLLLLRCGGDADRANAKGTTALMRAAQEGHEDIAQVLIQAKANVNRKNHEGMNALMLASQRGHAGVVLELIKNGAVTDEQTAQGSTALMLSCKRGHEKVVHVLVSMGAEICMKDCRNRTARDTAERRHHQNLSQYLDTQYQVKCIQEHVRLERAGLLNSMRDAALHGRLQLSRDTAILDSLITSLKQIRKDNGGNMYRIEDIFAVASSLSTSARPPRIFSPLKGGLGILEERTEGPVERIVNGGGSLNLCRNIATALSHAVCPPHLPPGMATQIPGNSDWEWPFILMRCLSLPLGVYEMIVEYLPSPRIWKWSLNRLKKRATLSPHISVIDISILIDEMVTDLNILDTPNQRGHLTRISNSSEVRKSLVNDLYIPEVLVENLTRWSDVQSLSFRMTELDVAFKSSLAKRYLVLAITLYRMMRLVHDPTRLFTLPKMLMQPAPTLAFSKKDQPNEMLQFSLTHNHSSSSPSTISLLQNNSQSSHGVIDDILFDGMLHQMIYDGIQHSNVESLDEDDSLNEFGGMANDHDTETELQHEGGNFAGSDDDEDDS